MSYECHITVPPPATMAELTYLQDLAKVHRFKTSQIDGDPLLGDKVFFYFTGHDEDLDKMRLRMFKLSSEIQDLAKTRILRRKIEQIVFDERA